MNEDELRVNTVRQSLLQPILFMGGERELALVSIMVGVAMVVFVQTWVAFFSGIALLCLTPPLLRAMAKRDAQMSQVYRRSLNYQKFYPAASTPHVQKAPKITAQKSKR